MGYFISAICGLMLVFLMLILQKKNKVFADYLLIVINVLLAAFLLSNLWVESDLSSASIIFQNSVPLLLYPTYTTYIYEFTHARKPKPRFRYLFFIPFAALLLLSIIDHYLLENYSSPALLALHFNEPALSYQIIFKLGQLLFIFGLVHIYQNLNIFRGEIRSQYSQIEGINIKWLKHFTIVYLICSVLTFLLFLGQNVGLLALNVSSVYSIVYGILIAGIFYLNYQGIQHYTLEQKKTSSLLESKGDSLQIEALAPPIKESTTTKNSSLSAEEQSLETEIIRRIEGEQWYLEPELSLDDLALRMDRQKHLVSRIINSKDGRTFYDLINGYRVEHLKNLLSDSENNAFTILALGLDSGFNSKASLNRIFKKMSGLTPREFRDQV